jgi:hypothetical protein
MSQSISLSDAAVEDIKCAAQHPITKQWVTGNALGQLNVCFSDTTYTVGDVAVNSLAFHPKGAELAIAHDNELKIHDAEDFSTVKFHAAARFTMPITHLQYSQSGQHM